MSKRKRRHGKVAAAGATAPAGPAWPGRLWKLLTAHPIRVCSVLVLVASVRIVATYVVFNHTIDEPAHIACGLEWLQKHTYRLEPQHPPLARIAGAIGPYLDGARLPDGLSNYQAGAVALYSGGDYGRRLALSRLGILPFFWLASAFVFLWARRSGGNGLAILAVFLFTSLPAVLAHAGLATTDMAPTAFTIGAFYAALVFAERPGFRSGLLLGILSALAVLSKFSALAFVPVTVGAMAVVHLAVERPGFRALLSHIRRWVLPLAAAAVVAALMVWAAYRFSFGPVHLKAPNWASLRVPAPEFFRGIGDAQAHLDRGHPAYLLGQRSQTGWWYYYFVLLAVKTPVAFLLLLAIGMFVWLRRVPKLWPPVVFSAALLAFSAFNRINIGLRHLLPVYAGLSLLAAFGALECVRGRRKWAVATGAVLLAWTGLASVLAHPDYLAYMNEFTGDAPEQILADSDLDWGQDMNRLGRRLQEVGATQVSFAPFVLIDYAKHGLPPVTPSHPQYPAPGWNAVSITVWKTTRMGLYHKYPEVRLWPDLVRRQERIGKSMLLYYFPPASLPGGG
jgi:hypothetical protein